MSETTRINKAISETGYCSRREADKLVAAGEVLINGELAVSGSQVAMDDVIKVKGKALKTKPPTVYLAFHKPPGITSTTDPKDADNIIDYIRYKERIFPVGRLDKASEGLIFMTNDGDIVNKILRAGNNHEKEYVVTVDHPITDTFIKKMSSGVRILGTVTKPCEVTRVSKYVFRIVLVQGLNRQIRRMSEVCGYEVKKLIRVRIMNVPLRGINPGKWRYLTEKEIKSINVMIKESSKTEEASTASKKPRKNKGNVSNKVKNSWQSEKKSKRKGAKRIASNHKTKRSR